MATTQKHYLKINPYLDIISGITVVLSFSDGIIKIIGREGSGKSVLTQLLAAELIEEDQEVVIFPDIPHTEIELHDPIQKQLHLKLDDNADFYVALNRYIQARPFDQQKLILVFDDADQIPEDCFQAIRILFEKNYHDRPEVSMVFAGTELLDQKLNEPQNRTFNKNIILNFELKPMNRTELEAFCNAYLVEMGLQKHHLKKADLDHVLEETHGLPGKIPELIFSILDREDDEKKAAPADHAEEKTLISKLVALDDDPEPELKGLSVEDREEVLIAFKDQVPWRWQSNGVGFAVVILFSVVAYGYFVPESERTNSIVVFPPPETSAGQLTLAQRRALAESLSDQQLLNAQLELTAPIQAGAATEPEPVIAEPAAVAVVEAEPEPEPEIAAAETPAQEPAVTGAAEPVAVAGTEPEPAVEPEPIAAEPAPVPAPVAAEPQVQASVQEPPAQEPPAALVVEATAAPSPQPQEPSPPARPELEPLTFVENWLSAWENQNTDAYFTAYQPGFRPAGYGTADAWRTDRASRIVSPADIDITLERAEIVAESDSETTVRVQFTYQAPAYADRTVKQLVLVADGSNWVIRDEENIAVDRLAAAAPVTAVPSGQRTLTPAPAAAGESGYAAKIRQVLSLSETTNAALRNGPYGEFLSEWLGDWKSQDVEGYFSHYHDNFTPAYFSTMSDWRADRIRKINEKRFIDITFDDVEVLDEDSNTTRIRFWLSYASSFYLDRTWKEVVIAGSNPGNIGILQERNLAIQIIPFYP